MTHTKRRGRAWLAAAGAIVALAGGVGCEPEFNETWRDPLDVAGPYISAGGEMVYVNRTLGEVLRVDPTRDGDAVDMTLTRARLGDEPGAAALSADRDELYVVDRAEETFSVVDLTSEDLEIRTVELASRYDRITVDPEGEFVLLSFTGDTDDRVIARNLNEVGIIDLRDEELEARFVTLSSRARQLVFAEPFELGGQRQRLVAALATSEVSLLDLGAEDPENQLREVPLTISEADATRTPTRALFDTTPPEDQPEQVSLYVLTDLGDDIIQINMQPSAREDSVFKFDVSVNQLAAGQSPGAMALVELPGQGTRLIAADSLRPRFTLVDVTSGEGATFDLPMTQPARQLDVYQAERPEGAELVTEVRVLASSQATPLVAVIRPETIAISGDEPTAGQSVEAIRLEATPQRVELDAQARERAVVFHAGLTGGFTVLDLRNNRDIPIQGYSLEDIRFDGLLAYGVFTGTANLGVFELESGRPSVFELPEQGQHISVDAQDGLLLVQHDAPTGAFTVLDAEEPVPGRARLWRDVFLTDIFDQELPDADQ